MTVFHRASQIFRSIDAGGLSKRSFSLLLFAVFIVLWCYDWPSLYGPMDFAAFRCGGAALRQHLDPYLIGSLSGCEQRLAPFYHPLLRHVTVPSPFPAYSLAFFSLFSYGSPLVVFTMWSFIQLAAFASSVALLHRVFGLSRTLIAAVMSVQIILISLPLGQLVPLIVAAICVTIYGVKYDKPLLATAGSVFSMLEPHIGLPTCIALFLVERRTRLALSAGAFFLGLVWYEALPLHTNLEYLRDVLPHHAMSEAFNDEQYSLTHLLVYFGFPATRALFFGSLSYVVMVLLGAVGAVSISRWKQDKVGAILFAPTIALLAGPYAHVQQMAVALIAALYMYSSSTTSRNVVTLMVLALPLTSVRTPIDVLVWFVLGATLPYLLYRKDEHIRATATAVGAIAFIAWASQNFQWSQRRIIRDPGFHQRALAYLSEHKALLSASTKYVDSQWQILLLQQLTSLGWITIVAHLMVWSALVSVLLSIGFSRDQVLRDT